MKNCVYRFLDKDNNIIYIGKAKDLNSRLNGHNHLPKKCYDETCKIEFIRFDTEDDMDFAERYYIPKYKPKYNTHMNRRNISLEIYELDNRVWEEKSKEHKDKNEIKINKKEKRKIYLENFKKAYDEKENLRLDKLKRDLNKKIIIASTGEVFENINEFIEFTKTCYPPELLIDVCRYNTSILIKHPVFYDVYCLPQFLDNYLAFSNEQKRNIKSRQEVNTKKIICLTTGEVFINVHQARDKYNLKNIWDCCKGLSNYCGIYNNTPLVWKWYDSYMKMDEYEINNLINKAYSIFNKRNKTSKNYDKNK